jgi:hypothetical protein
MKKKFLTRQEKQTIKDKRTNTIIESFAKTFNKIKRVNEDELKEWGGDSEFGYGGEFDNTELQGQEDFYDNMNQNEGVDFNNPEEATFQILSRYIKDPDNIEKAMGMLRSGGYQRLPNELKANLNRDMDWITLSQIEHDTYTRDLEGLDTNVN